MCGKKSRVRRAAGRSTITAIPTSFVSRRLLKHIKTTRPATCIGPMIATLARMTAVSTRQVVKSGTSWKIKADWAAL